MPESGNIHPAFLMIDAIDDPVGPHNNLANERIVKLGHDSPHLREISEPLCVADEELAEGESAFR